MNAWLIEFQEGAPRWLSVIGNNMRWTPNAYEALKFADEVSAKQVMHYYKFEGSAIVNEHEFE